MSINKNSWDSYSKNYLEITKNLKNSYKPLAAIMAIVLLIWGTIFIFNYVNSHPQVKNLIILATTVKPETFTELYFENHMELPSYVSLKKKYSFAFTIHNLENEDMDYPYEVYIASDESKLDILSQGSVSIKKDGYKTINEDFTLLHKIGRVKVVVNLIKKSQQIDFWIESI